MLQCAGRGSWKSNVEATIICQLVAKFMCHDAITSSTIASQEIPTKGQQSKNSTPSRPSSDLNPHF
jgi:hypothetical protein